MKRVLPAFLLALVCFVLWNEAGIAHSEKRERLWLSKCVSKIRRNFVEPQSIRSDPMYKKMRIVMSFFLSKDGSIYWLQLDKDCTIYQPKIGRNMPAYFGLTSRQKDLLIEKALLSAVRKSAPLPTEGFECNGPYCMILSYEPGMKTKWELADCPPPANGPVIDFKSLPRKRVKSF